MTARVLGFPADRAPPVELARLRCEECGAPPMIFVPAPWPCPRVHAYCGPACAAGCGVEPWASMDLVDRTAWRDRAELEAEAR